MSIPVIYANTQYIAGKHLFKTIPDGTSLTLTSLANVPTCNVMTLVNANVGIGTTDPTASLHIIPDSSTTGVIINQVGSGSILDIQDGGASKVIINGNGNIGIGTTAPRQYLDVQGGNAIVSGSIGIGTTNPTSILHVVGASLLNGAITTNNNNINAGTGTITASTFSGTATQVSSTLTRGTYLTGNNFTGAAATTWAVDATSANTASKVVARDASGNFSAGTITATLSGTATQVSSTLTRGSYLTGNNFTGAAATTWAVDATEAATASKIVARDSSGDIFCRLVRSDYTDQTTISGAMAYRVSTTDNYIRFCSDEAAIRTHLNVPTRTGGDASGTWGINITGSAASLTGATTAGSVGSYGLFGTLSLALRSPGATLAGSSLRYANTMSQWYETGGNERGIMDVAPAGTWRLMGNNGYYYRTSYNSSVNYNPLYISLWFRIS